MPQPLPDEVRRFLLTGVPSVPYLEAMLLLRGEPARAFSVDEVARRLYLPTRLAAGLLQALEDSGISSRTDQGHRFSPREEATRRVIDALALAYNEDLIGVTTLIHDATGKNAWRFADAFKFRREP